MESRSIPTPPPDDEGLRLYQALLQQVPTATWDFAPVYLRHLAAWLQVKYPHVSTDLCDDAAGQTISSIFHHPQQFDPGKGMTLLAYLRMAAERDLLNLLAREKRHAHEPLDENRVALHHVGRKPRGKGMDPLQILCDREDEQQRQAFLQELRGRLAEPEQKVLDLLLQGERKTPAFAEALGIAHLVPAAQEAEVKRVKDRIKKRIKRMGGGSWVTL